MGRHAPAESRCITLYQLFPLPWPGPVPAGRRCGRRPDWRTCTYAGQAHDGRLIAAEGGHTTATAALAHVAHHGAWL